MIALVAVILLGTLAVCLAEVIGEAVVEWRRAPGASGAGSTSGTASSSAAGRGTCETHCVEIGPSVDRLSHSLLRGAALRSAGPG